MEGRIDYSFIDKCIQNQLSFAAYTLPGQNDFSMMLQKAPNAKKIDDTEDFSSLKGFMIAPFETSFSPKLIMTADFYLTEDEVNFKAWNFVKDTRRIFRFRNELPVSTSVNNYWEQFESFHSLIQKGKVQKLVLSRVINTYKRNNLSYADIFKSLNQNYSAAFNYLLFTPETGIWLGASPEILLNIEEGEASTVALAGTQQLQNIPLNKYDWGEKEKQEQQIVVDFVEKVIKKYVATGDIKKHTRTIKAANAVHLQTSFNFNAEKISPYLKDYLSDLHPTPAVCGLPKSAALKFICDKEEHERELYCGYLGPINFQQQTKLFVNLRCLKADGNNLALFVGGGITLDSEAQSEWEETTLKAQTLLSLIN